MTTGSPTTASCGSLMTCDRTGYSPTTAASARSTTATPSTSRVRPAWACYYNSFPIVRLSGETVTGWRNQITGATGLLVDGDVCALVGGYREDHARVVVGGLDEGQLQPIGQRLLVMPGGQPLPPGIRYLSRGADLHVFIDTVWYRLGLDDLI